MQKKMLTIMGRNAAWTTLELNSETKCLSHTQKAHAGDDPTKSGITYMGFLMNNFQTKLEMQNIFWLTQTRIFVVGTWRLDGVINEHFPDVELKSN